MDNAYAIGPDRKMVHHGCYFEATKPADSPCRDQTIEVIYPYARDWTCAICGKTET